MGNRARKVGYGGPEDARNGEKSEARNDYPEMKDSFVSAMLEEI